MDLVYVAAPLIMALAAIFAVVIWLYVKSEASIAVLKDDNARNAEATEANDKLKKDAANTSDSSKRKWLQEQLRKDNKG